ncbi:hypothetical protein [Methylobacterium ajmalii]|jgi:hypothetical protein|uniref:hypothetical protein n=1 Tax=Methylobacterium ajmalii TaxID=2738439 RepID=UPI0019098081|nr:hypothetical protein [Methylobacterium ajmalii]MBK3398117.1 hypothetical protein [Methylobacterium ajmalii]MBK3406851.1 hypothetical protein [Methylobacterium ajmalii]MBK3420658.1 hypothetical protein [Methylobacterium ajmalii]MBZ6415742.1 hypothetical protein [Methylobacterium sp.]
MKRPSIRANDLAAQKAWLAAAVDAPFHTPRILPRLTRPRPKTAPPAAPEPGLLALLDAALPPATTPRPGERTEDVLMRYFAGVIAPLSPLALKRRELRRAREAAASA